MLTFYEKLYDVLGFFSGPLMYGIYSFIGNYGVAIILMTLFFRILMLPTAVKQQKNAAKNQRMQFKMRKIQERYKDDKRKQQEEVQAFYRREGYNPMSAGCSASMLLQFPIIFALIAAIYRPLQYTIKLSKEALGVINSLISTGSVPGIDTGGQSSRFGSMWQLQVVSHLEGFKKLSKDGIITLKDTVLDHMSFAHIQTLLNKGELTFSEKTQAAITAAADKIETFQPKAGLSGKELLLAQLGALQESGFDALKGSEAAFSAGGILQSISEFKEHFTFGPVDLGVMPGVAKGWYILIPILAGLASMASSVYTFLRQRKQNPEQSKNFAMMGCMTFGMPLFSAYLAFNFPAGVAIYWIASSLVAFVQMVVLAQTHKPSRMLGRLMVEETVERRSRENSRRKVHELRK
ncbi:MAG: YidC/Oxa1 family membrane protein insertase [Oscillospiraceae bacterium]|jgi:YidC/Oxa1 family membrane protein insertase|nr:YidC/Oxa1 family membrane protein insertase [Oscillospiraceae bacterium]